MSEAQSALAPEEWKSLIPDIRERIVSLAFLGNHSFTNALIWIIPLAEEMLNCEDITQSFLPDFHHANIDLSLHLVRSRETQDSVTSPIIRLYATKSDSFSVTFLHHRASNSIYSYSFDLKQTVEFLFDFIKYMPHLSAEND